MKTFLMMTSVLVSAVQAGFIYDYSDAFTNVTFSSVAAQIVKTSSFSNDENALVGAFLQGGDDVSPTSEALSLQVFRYTGSAADATLDLAKTTLVATSLNTRNRGTSYSFNFDYVILDPNALYVFGFNDGTNQFATVRLLTASDSGVSQAGNSYSLGSNSGLANQVWGGSIYTSVVPEPSVAVLGGLGAVVMLRRRRG